MVEEASEERENELAATDDDPKDQPEGEVLPPELAKKISPEIHREVSAYFMAARSTPDPLGRVVKPEHITQAMEVRRELAKDNAKKNFEFAKGTRKYQFAVFLVAIAVTLFLIVYLIEKDKTQFLAPLLTAILGFASGYGIGRKTK